MGSTSGEEKGREGKTEHRKKLSCDSVSLEASANPKRSSEARTLFICARLDQGNPAFIFPLGSVIGCELLWKGQSFQPGSPLEQR